MDLKFAGLFSGGTLLKTEFSTKLQAAGVNATAYAAKLPGGQTSVIILNKDVVTELEVTTPMFLVTAWAVWWKPKHYRHQH